MLTLPEYSVRWKGKITGPYPLGQLKTMVAQGQLSKLHELSTDGSTWHQA